MNRIDFLKEYINTPSPSGYEMLLGGQKVWIEYVRPFCNRVEIDNYGNAYAFYGPNPNFISGIKTVLLDAHGDEVGFFVFDITKDGFIKIGRLGGSDISIAPAARVDIWGEKGTVKGIFGHPAIHIQVGDFKAKLEDMFIDIGVSSKEEVEELGITIGTPITMSDGFMDLGKFYCGRSLDDKIGGFITAQVLKTLHENKVELPFQLVVVNAVQEEVGLHGAQLAAGKIKPDVAIVIDVTHDTDSPAYCKKKQGSVSAGKGIVLANAPSIQKNLLKLLIDTAKENEIKYQLSASGRGSGTNADSYAYPHGIPTALLKMGMRYMHSTVECVHKEDVDSAINLLCKVLHKRELIGSLKYE
jgi:putative aminopeptidase FrvX